MKESKFVKAKIAAGYVILIAACILSVGYVYREAVRLSAPDGSYALLRNKRSAVNQVLYHLYQAESYGGPCGPASTRCAASPGAGIRCRRCVWTASCGCSRTRSGGR